MPVLHRRRLILNARGLVSPRSYPDGLLGFVMGDAEPSFVDGGAAASLQNQKDGSIWGSQATSTHQPTFRQNGINGKRAVQYGPDDFLLPPNAALSWFSGVTAYTWVGLIQFTSVVASQTIGPNWGTPTSGNNRCAVWINTSKKWELVGRRRDTDPQTMLTSNTLVDTNAHVAHALIDYGTAKARVWLDGALIATSDAFLTAGSTDNTVSLLARLHASIQAVASSFSNAFVRHEALWSHALYDTDLVPMVRSWCTDGGIAYAGV